MGVYLVVHVEALCFNKLANELHCLQGGGSASVVIKDSLNCPTTHRPQFLIIGVHEGYNEGHYVPTEVEVRCSAQQLAETLHSYHPLLLHVLVYVFINVHVESLSLVLFSENRFFLSFDFLSMNSITYNIFNIAD